MPIVTNNEFDINEGASAVLKLVPVNDAGGDASIENVDFKTGDELAGVGLSVHIDNPLMFDLAIPLGVSGDLTLILHADGHVGEGETVIDKVFTAHVKGRDAVDVQLDVNITP